jgi:hypothetical protein
MVAATVARLRLRGPRPGCTTVAQVADALRLAPDDGARLLVLRHLALGRWRLDARSAALADAATARLRDAAARAVHGDAPGACDAGAVWFRSAEEARSLLLLRLAAGERPAAWFWRLAVPDWRGRSLGEWLPALLAEADGNDRATAALARMLLRAAEAGRLAAVVTALPARPIEAAAAPRGGAPPPAPSPSEVEPPGRPDPGTETFVALQTHLAPLAEPVRATFLAAIRAAPPGSFVRQILARSLLLAARPHISRQPGLLASLARVLCSEPASRDARLAPRIRFRDRTGAAEAADPPRLRMTPEALTPDAVASHTAAPRQMPANELPATTADAALPSLERASAAAGLFLVVPLLGQLGFPAWLEGRAELAAAGFAPGLLRHIAGRHRVAAGDPIFTVLPAETAVDWAGALTLWRIGLDRWLRRTVRLRLADLVGRRGGLVATEERIDVRFPLAAADLRLRRRALDADPGWTPWLGISVFYHFRDEPLP